MSLKEVPSLQAFSPNHIHATYLFVDLSLALVLFVLLMMKMWRMRLLVVVVGVHVAIVVWLMVVERRRGTLLGRVWTVLKAWLGVKCVCDWI